MLRFFQKAYLSQYVVLLLITIVFWIPSFVLNYGYSEDTSPAFRFLLQIGDINPYLLSGITIAATLILGLLVNNIAGDHEFSSKLSTTAMFIFLLFVSSSPSFTLFNPFFIVNLLLLFFIRSLFMIPASEFPIKTTFNAGLIIGIASLFFLPIIYLFLIIWFALIIYRSNAWRNYVVSIIGVLLPHIFILTWHFWKGNTENHLLKLNELITLKSNLLIITFNLDLVIILIFLILFVIAFARTIATLSAKNINLRRNLIISQYFLLFTFFIAFLFSGSHSGFLLVAIPGTFLLANFLPSVKQLKFYNATFMVLILLILINQYYGLFALMLNQSG